MARRKYYDKEAGRLRNYQLDPRWDELTASQRGVVENLPARDRDEYLEYLYQDNNVCEIGIISTDTDEESDEATN